MFRLTSLRIGTLFVLIIAIPLSLKYHELVMPAVNVIIASAKVILLWCIVQLRRSIFPIVKAFFPWIAIFALPRSLAVRIRNWGRYLRSKSDEITLYFTTRFTWLKSQPVKILLAITFTGFCLFLSLILTGWWVVYIFGWHIVWKWLLTFAVIPAIRIVEGLIFRTAGGIFVTFGFGKFWSRQPWVLKYRRTYAHRQAIKARKARDRMVERIKQKVSRQKSEPSDSTTE